MIKWLSNLRKKRTTNSYLWKRLSTLQFLHSGKKRERQSRQRSERYNTLCNWSVVAMVMCIEDTRVKAKATSDTLSSNGHMLHITQHYHVTITTQITLRYITFKQSNIWRDRRLTYLSHGHSADAGVQNPCRRICTHLAHEGEFLSPANTVLLHLLPVMKQNMREAEDGRESSKSFHTKMTDSITIKGFDVRHVFLY